jgi:hypothetical protein
MFLELSPRILKIWAFSYFSRGVAGGPHPKYFFRGRVRESPVVLFGRIYHRKTKYYESAAHIPHATSYRSRMDQESKSIMPSKT